MDDFIPREEVLEFVRQMADAQDEGRRRCGENPSHEKIPLRQRLTQIELRTPAGFDFYQQFESHYDTYVKGGKIEDIYKAMRALEDFREIMN